MEYYKLTVYKDDASFSPKLDNQTPHKSEWCAFLKRVIAGDDSEIISSNSTKQSVHIVLTKVESAKKDKSFNL